MSVHDLARAASADLRSHTVVDVDAGLDALLVAHDRRRRHSRFAIASVAAAAVLVAWWGVAGLGDHRTGLEPAPAPTPTSPPLLVPQGRVCQQAVVTCLGHRTYRFALGSPVTWQIPAAYGVDSGGGATTRMVESYSRSGSYGVTVMEGVRAASPAGLAAPGVPATASGFIHWLAQRPYLRASAVRRTIFDRRSAWQVRVVVKAHRGAGPGRCAGGGPVGRPCHAITYQDGDTTGVWSDMSADYTAVDMPGVGTVVVWSWAFGHDRAALARNRTVVDGISLTR
jgi:hypothetical protein